MAWAATGVAAVGVASSIFGGMAANSAAKEAAQEQADLTFMKRMEEIRQKTRAADAERGAGVAAVGASNIQKSGSAQRHLGAVDMENAREITYAKDAARREKRAIKAGAQGAGDSLFYKAAGDAIGFAAGAYASGLYSNVGASGVENTFKSQASSGLHSYTDTPGVTAIA
jgi:hypothetical protein